MVKSQLTKLSLHRDEALVALVHATTGWHFPWQIIGKPKTPTYSDLVVASLSVLAVVASNPPVGGRHQPYATRLV